MRDQRGVTIRIIIKQQRNKATPNMEMVNLSLQTNSNRCKMDLQNTVSHIVAVVSKELSFLAHHSFTTHAAVVKMSCAEWWNYGRSRIIALWLSGSIWSPPIVCNLRTHSNRYMDESFFFPHNRLIPIAQAETNNANIWLNSSAITCEYVDIMTTCAVLYV